MQNEELTITAGDEHAGTQKAYSIHQVKPEKPWYEIALGVGRSLSPIFLAPMFADNEV
jgi:hypothetical protein